MTLTPGAHLSKYEVICRIGAGGMGEVYRARDLELGRDVAIKVLPAEVASSPDRLARLGHEARTVASLNHPNIVTIFSVEEENGVRFLTMELVEGLTLSAEVMPGGLQLSRILEIVIPLTDALVAAHERGVIHRDLKPGNVMVTREGRVKVLDFGLAKTASGDASPRDVTMTGALGASLSSEGHVVGTLPYVSPEQLCGDAVDARADLFSLGVILYELASGQRPFREASRAEVISSILRDTPEPLSRIRADLPAELERIVNCCLEKRPRDRVQSALNVNNDLRRLRKEASGVQAVQPGSDRTASIAVLPFVNRSASPDDEYFSDGLADELLNVLAKIKGLRVIARTSSFHFKGKDVTIADVGKALDVGAVLEGSVRKAGNRVRISVQLVSVADSSHLWSETYDRTLDDIFAVQDDIAKCVVSELRTTLLGAEADSDASGQARADIAQAAKGRGTDPEAHRLSLLGRHLLDRGTREDCEKGVGYLREAVERDPGFALAWVTLAEALTKQSDMGWIPISEGYGKARDAVQRALSLEDDLAEAHSQLGRMRMLHDRDWRAAETSFARALQVAPGNAVALRGTGVLAMHQGRLEEAIDLTRRSLAQDPLSVPAYVSLGMSLFAADRFTEAEAAYRRASELAPQRGAVRAHLALALVAQGRGDEALAESDREPHEGFKVWALAIVHHLMGNREKSDAALRDLVDMFAGGGPYQIAEVFGARGELEAAFEWLHRARDQHDGGLAEMKSSPRLRSLHADPRWGAFLKEQGFES